MPKTIPMIITNDTILVKEKDGNKFRSFDMPAIEPEVNIPFYHEFAKRISECQYYFKEFIKRQYGNKLSRNVLAIIVPDDTSALEGIFINEFFLNSGACKAVCQMTMGQALSKKHSRYISLSKTKRNVILQYINDNDISRVDISHNPKLKYFYCHNNRISSIDATGNPLLRHLNATGNPMKEIRAFAPQREEQLPLELYAGEGGHVGMQFNPVYNAQWKETGEWQQTYYAYPEDGYSFTCWTENGEQISGEPVLDDEYGTSRILTAHFEYNKL